MRPSCVPMIVVALVAVAGEASAVTLRGGGSPSTDCALVFEIPGANKPALPATAKAVDCIDGDPTCDDDGTRNGECVFPLQVCANSTLVADCAPDTVNTAVVDHAIDDGEDRRFDVDFQALQSRIAGIGLPSSSQDDCTIDSAVTVRLIGPDSADMMKKARKTVRITTDGTTLDGDAHDVDKVKFTCRPEGDRVYLPIDLYDGTFDRIRDQVFAQSCALSGCHDSEGNAGDLILLAGAAYGNLVDVTPNNPAAASDLLKRVTPGDPSASLLYRKLTGDLEADYGEPMPLEGDNVDPELIEIIRLWIIGDGMLGQAPAEGWVLGTDE